MRIKTKEIIVEIIVASNKIRKMGRKWDCV